ncbi:MAG: NAD-dependent epimerase/dehydratase family protein [Candidatus Methanoperedens sp.]|nr:NAD-dependent epimerase/dehydratase family protein [Candidatus Methanoperedens sp.]
MINSNWKNKNVFITGATGLLGSWLTRLMVDERANVIALNRDIVPRSILWSSSREFEYIKDELTVVHGCLEDYSFLERVLNEYEIEVVFHLGAQTIVGTANRNPLSTFESNIRGTYNLLEACRRNKELIKAVIVASSDKAYGVQEKLPYDEKTPLCGTHPYDVSKSCADLIAHTYFNTYRLPVCVTRCGNLYGPGDLNFNRIIPGTIQSLLKGENPIIRSDGSYIRDYFYVRDGALAYKILAERMMEDKILGESFNFSNEIHITVLELVKKIIGIMEVNLEPVILGKATNEIKHQYLSAQKARSMLNWAPNFTLDEGLKETIDWYKMFLKK